MSEIVWTPDKDRKRLSQMQKFIDWLNATTKHQFESWEDLYNWSITELDKFWWECSRYLQIKWHNAPRQAYIPGPSGTFTGVKWFPNATLNYAENLLTGENDKQQIESYVEGQHLATRSIQELRDEVAHVASYMESIGIVKGDVVFGILSNTYHSIVAMLASSTLGAVWSSCSPDFGAQGILDRMLSVKARCIFVTPAYRYNSKHYNCLPTIDKVLQKLDPIPVVAISLFNEETPSSYRSYDSIIADPSYKRPLKFKSLEFFDPLFIMFSSGTTGKAKCIVHSVGGTLIQHKKEHVLHTDLDSKDKLLYFSTCAWMMWNWQVSALASGSNIVTYDGSPTQNSGGSIWNLVADTKVTVFGTSPKFISVGMNAGYNLKGCKFPALKTLLSTGSPLLPRHYDWVYTNVKRDLHLASISGGTDIISCFMLGNPLLPVYRGKIQAPGLGMAIEAWNQHGKAVYEEKGELVCVKPFVSAPTHFLDDQNAEKINAAYFNYFERKDQSVWRHGDYISIAPNGNIVVYGRSDATLNPGGVRIGTAEIYRCVEALDEIDDSLASSLPNKDGDEDVILFIKTAHNLDESLKQKIRAAIKNDLSPRHSPKLILRVREIPYTRSGKKVEIAINKVIRGEAIENLTALENPEAIEEFRRAITGHLAGD